MLNFKKLITILGVASLTAACGTTTGSDGDATDGTGSDATVGDDSMGDMVMGAIPMPAETSETASARWVSNQPVTQAIIVAKMADAAPPMPTPNTTWKARSEVIRLASASDVTSSKAPISTTRRGPMRSDRLPQAMPPTAMVRKPMVMAVETPVTDQWVALATASSITGRLNIEPMATQPSRPPAARTMAR